MKKRYIAPIIRKVDIESDPLMEVVSMPVIDNGGAYGGELMKNPYSTITKIGDPFILYANGAYYMYATSTGTGFKCWKSKLLDRWTELGVVYQKTDATFGDQKFWAPECHEYKGKYYLIEK